MPIPRMAIVGGGISGLAAARRLADRLPQASITVFEAAPRLGGLISSLKRDGWLIERSADSFITKIPGGIELCRRLGFDELISTKPQHRRAQVVSNGRVCDVPDGFVLMSPSRVAPLLRTPILTWPGKFRLLMERWIPPQQQNPRQDESIVDDESIASFARRRLGVEAFERLVQPLVAGIYAGDPERLSVAATMPQFVRQEKEHGSLTRAARQQRSDGDSDAASSGARYGAFVAPRMGMQSLIAAIIASLPQESIRANAPVTHIATSPNGEWRLTVNGVVQPFDGLIIATPVHEAAQLVAHVDATLSDGLARIESTGTVVVSLGYSADAGHRPPRSFGIVVPTRERRDIIAVSFSSVKFAGRAPPGHLLARVFLGGSGREEALSWSDEELVATAHSELQFLLGMDADPVRVDVARWPQAMPQYHVGHLSLTAEIASRVAKLPGLELAGNAYSGVGIPQCIQSGGSAADRLAEWWNVIGADG